MTHSLPSRSLTNVSRPSGTEEWRAEGELRRDGPGCEHVRWWGPDCGANMARLAASGSLRMARWQKSSTACDAWCCHPRVRSVGSSSAGSRQDGVPQGASKPAACRDTVAFCRAARARGLGHRGSAPAFERRGGLDVRGLAARRPKMPSKPQLHGALPQRELCPYGGERRQAGGGIGAQQSIQPREDSFIVPSCVCSRAHRRQGAKRVLRGGRRSRTTTARQPACQPGGGPLLGEQCGPMCGDKFWCA